MKKTVKGFVDSEGNEYQYKDEIARSQNQNLEEEINSNKTYMDKVKTELKNDNKTLNGRIDTILTGAVNTTKLVTVHSATIRNNSASDLTFKISSKDNETLKSIKDKSPTVINANVIAKALDGVAINGKGIPSSYNVESTNDEYVITVYSGSSSVVGQYVFMAVVTIAYEDIATDISSAELKDVRVGTDGITYESAGAAVRQQIGSLKSDTCRIKKSLRTTYVDMNLFALGTINKDTGEEESSNKILRSIIDVNATEDITIKLPKGYQWNVAHWLAGKYRSDLWNENGWYQNLTIEKTTANYKYRILIRRLDGADITLSELIGVAETNREDLQSFDKIDDLKKKLGGKVDKEDGKGLSSNDYTNSDKEKLDNLNNYDDTDVKEQIGELKESLDNYRDVNNNCFEHENIDNGSTIKNSTIDYNNGNPISPGFGVQVKTDAPILSVSIKIKASASDNLICSILKDATVVCFDSKPVTTNLSELVFEFPRNYVNGVVTIRLKTENNSNISYSTRAGGYTSDIMPEYNGQYLFEQYNNKEWSQVYSTINTMLLYVKSRKTFTVKESVSKAIKEEKIVNYVFVATSGNDATGDGTEENPYATIYKANETITDSSETNKYEIIVKQGTYTDLQEKYSGENGNSYQGVVCKPYVTYRSENILKPDLCTLKWDGADGYTKPVTDANCVNKCLFHIPTNSKGVYIKGFTFESKNTRYCMHIETTGSTDECDWHFENCVFNWGGRPDTIEDGTVATACIGTGYSMLEFGEFINCIIKCTNTNHANHMVFQSHDNPDNIFTSIKRGEHLRFENCYFSIADGSDYAHIDLRTTKTSPIIPSFAEFINCSGIKLYVPSETYKKSFVCTEQHTIN